MKTRLWLASSLVLLLSACGGGGNGCSSAFGSVVGNSSLCEKTPNKTPVAHAGDDQSVTLRSGLIVTLDGSRSIDPDGQSLNYTWSWLNKPSNSASQIASANAVKAAFVPDVAGTYIAALVVNDGQASSPLSTVSVVVSLSNSAPVANAGIDQNVTVGATVTLNGSLSSDADSDPIQFEWRLINQPTGSSQSPTPPDSARPTFVASQAGTYVAQLIVSDGRQKSEPKVVTINASAQNLAPVANAGADQSVSLKSGTTLTVTLDGTSSFDPNPGDRITFQWALVSQPPGSSLSLSNPTTSKPTFSPTVAGSYVASLVVTDDKQLSSAHDTVTVDVSADNAAPVANAGPNQTVVVNKTAQLDGRGSSDSDRDLLSYQWTLVSSPPGSALTAIPGSTLERTSFVPDKVGTYVVSLVVFDGKVYSPTASVTVITVVPNSPPVANAGPSQTVSVGTEVTLDGRLSTDPDGDTLQSYTWIPVSWPGIAPPILTIDPANPAQRRFTPGNLGSYVFELVVNDGKTDSLPATVIITVN